MKERIQELAARNRMAKTQAEKKAIAEEMENLRKEDPKEFTECLESLIKSTAEKVEELTIAERWVK